MELDIGTLVIHRAQIKAANGRMLSFLEQISFDGSKLLQLPARFRDFEANLYRFREIQNQIELLQSPSSLQLEEEERLNFEDTYFDIVARCQNLLATFDKTNLSMETKQSTPIASPAATAINLAPIDLPKFDGQFSNWLSFRDLFIAIVDKNPLLSDVQKLYYLKSSIVGVAKNILQSVETTADNYQLAWERITNRFENEHILIRTHIDAILDLKKVASESPNALRTLVDECTRHLRALSSLKKAVDSWDTILVQIIVRKLDPVTTRAWETKTASIADPPFNELIEFLTGRAQILETLQHRPDETQNVSNIRRTNNTKTLAIADVKCANCSKSHGISQCENFLKMSQMNRLTQIRRLQLCINCLKPGHFVANCTSSNCRKCGQRHHTLLHFENSYNDSQPAKVNKETSGTPLSRNSLPRRFSPEPIEANSSRSSPVQRPLPSQPGTRINSTEHCNANTARSTTLALQFENNSQVLLSTALVYVTAANGQTHQARALLDSASQSHFVSQTFFSKLGLNAKNTQHTVTGIGGSLRTITSYSKLQCKSTVNNYRFSLNCLVVNEISQMQPSIEFDKNVVQIPTGITLADPTFNETSDIDILIGAEIFFKLLCIGQLKGTKNQPIFQKTLLGWIVSGSVQLPSHGVTACHFSRNLIDNNLEKQVEKFWAMDTLCSKPVSTDDELLCEENFVKTTYRTTDGHFVVEIPFKQLPTNLGNSYDVAAHRLKSMERRFQNNADLQHGYTSFINEYESLGHMSPIDIAPLDCNYLPHHAVMNLASKTTKLRVVFDATAKTSENTCLNDFQHAGPALQEDLLNILLRFREYKFIIAADIHRMFRQIWIAPNHRKYQQILWRSEPNSSLRIYQLNTVTYGLKSSPYLAIRCLRQLSQDNSAEYPDAARIIARNMYVDDLLTGHNDLEELKLLRDQIIAILKQGGFRLQKWCSNDSRLLPTDAPNNRMDLDLDNDGEQKLLGVIWNPVDDCLHYHIKDNHSYTSITKRVILSITASIFDPLGLLAPVVMLPKLLIQTLWQLKILWDTSVPVDVYTIWMNFYSELSLLRNISLPRCVTQPSDTTYLHGFADASERAFGCCIYIQTVDSLGNASTNLLCAKGRVAPLKTISIPRLELCAALLLSQLYHRVVASLDLKFEKAYLWSDSTIVLSWLNGEPRNWKTFVSNRTAEIQNLTKGCDWRHVDSLSNPADLISRGALPSQIATSELWWCGPSWINCIDLWPTSFSCTTPVECEQRTTTLHSTKNFDFEILDKFSSVPKMQRIVAYILRYKNNSLTNIENRKFGTLSLLELNIALQKLVWLSQHRSFSEEIHSLKKTNSVAKVSKLTSLCPYLDENGLVRVGGRLQNSDLTYNQQHPFVLSPNCNFAKQLIRYYHLVSLHSGPQSTHCALRIKFWILSGQSAVKKIVRNCVVCFRAKPRPLEEIMASLPADRCQATAPFAISGVDFGGPLTIVDSHGRGKHRTARKCYFAVFVCFATKATHLEAVTNLTSEAFLACLRRFTSRRGAVRTLYSDNATTFHGASIELKKLYNLSKSEEVQQDLLSLQLEWKNIPPRSPHHGGLWEASIKSVKHHLRRVAGNSRLTFEELSTLLCQVEACLNSRPLSPLSSDPNDLLALTPFHFLIGNHPSNLPDPDLATITINRLSRWQHVQKLRQNIWTRWKKEYLHNLQTRTKWTRPSSSPLRVGDLVIIVDDNLPPLQWSLGRVTELHTAKDGYTRVVSVRTSQGTYKRSIAKLCLLPMDN